MNIKLKIVKYIIIVSFTKNIIYYKSKFKHMIEFVKSIPNDTELGQIVRANINIFTLHINIAEIAKSKSNDFDLGQYIRNAIMTN